MRHSNVTPLNFNDDVVPGIARFLSFPTFKRQISAKRQHLIDLYGDWWVVHVLDVVSRGDDKPDWCEVEE